MTTKNLGDPSLMTGAAVFHASQIENMPELPKQEKELAWNSIEKVDKLVASSKAVIENDILFDPSHYNFVTDIISMPTRQQYPGGGAYYVRRFIA